MSKLSDQIKTIISKIPYLQNESERQTATDSILSLVRAEVEKIRVSKYHDIWEEGYNHALSDVLALLKGE